MLTQAELDARIGRVTSSVAAAIFDCDPYVSPYGAKLKILGLAPAVGDTPAITRGNFCEAACLDYAAARMEVKWRKPPFVAHANGWSGASTDAIFYKPGIDGDAELVLGLGEAKTVGAHGIAEWGPSLSDHIPDRHLIQCCWHFYHWPDVDTCYVPVLFGGYKFSFDLYVVRRNDALINQLIADAWRWYETYIANDAPLTPDDRDLPAVRRLYPETRAPLMGMDATLESLAQEKVKLTCQKSAISYRENAVKAQILELLKDHAGARNERFEVLLKPKKKPAKVNWDRVLDKLDIPADKRAALLAECTEQAGVERTLQITELAPTPAPIGEP